MSDIYNQVKTRMLKSLENLKLNLNTLRTGRANASILDNIEVDYYGDKMPINQIATVKVPEPRQLLITPYDKNDVKSIVAAINTSQLGINPVVDGANIRLIMPALTEDRRKELAKKAKSYGEETKVTIRNIRRDEIESLKKSENVSEDLIKRGEEDIQKATNEVVLDIDKFIKEKEKDIMAV